jgi:serine/threonine-protein kinase
MTAVNVGEVLGSYRITSQLGEGGVGVVYLASHKLIGREAAIKVLRPEFSADHQVVEQFFNDAKTTTAIKHPSIVDIYDFGFSDRGSPFIVMERLEGISLRERLDSTILEPRTALLIARQIAGALGAAHERGVVHRSLKPDNVFLVDDAEMPGKELVKILDFGASKLRGGNDAHLFKTATGQTLGFPSYMAPEQCLGSSRIDHRADLYSLGCILFHMVCGRPPFVGAAVGQVLSAHVNMSPPQPRSITPSIPGDVERLILRLLEKSPEKRYKNAGVLAGAIDEISARLPSEHEVTTGRVSLGKGSLPPSAKRDDPTLIAGGAVPAPHVDTPEFEAIERPRTPMHTPPPPGHTPSRPMQPPQPPSVQLARQSADALPPVYGPPPDETEDRYVYDGGIRKKDQESTLRGAAGVRGVTDDGERSSKLGMIVLVLALAAGGASAYFIATSTNVSAEEEPAVAANATRSDQAAQKRESGAAGEDDTPGSGDDESAQQPEQARSVVMVFVTINSQPEGATVFLGDKKVGFTPFRAEVPSISGNSSYVLKLAGHKDSVVVVPGDRSSAETVELEQGEGTSAPIEPAASEADAGVDPVAPAPADPPPKDPPPKDPPPKQQAKSQPKSPKPGKPKKPRGTVDYTAPPLDL